LADAEICLLGFIVSQPKLWIGSLQAEGEGLTTRYDWIIQMKPIVKGSVKFKAVLFDLDGTLLDTLQDLADSMNTVLERFGFPSHPLEDYKYFVGEGMASLVRRTLPESRRNQEETVATCLASMKEIYGGRWMGQTRPYPGIPELLDQLSARKIMLSVLSNKPNDFTRMMVKNLLPFWHFEYVFGERPNIPRKPDPFAALEICELSRISPEAFVYLGDTATDMITAKSAGMYAVGVTWGFRPAEELTENGANTLISKPTDLLDLFWRLWQMG
jgi:phosphoglycolate phosphatase